MQLVSCTLVVLRLCKLPLVSEGWCKEPCPPSFSTSPTALGMQASRCSGLLERQSRAESRAA